MHPPVEFILFCFCNFFQPVVCDPPRRDDHVISAGGPSREPPEEEPGTGHGGGRFRHRREGKAMRVHLVREKQPKQHYVAVRFVFAASAHPHAIGYISIKDVIF